MKHQTRSLIKKLAGITLLCMCLLQFRASAVLSAPQTLAQHPDTTVITQEIRYHLAEAGEVFLIWGIDGWQPVPEESRPSGTTIKDKLMRTPMEHRDDRFVATVQVPSGSQLQYGFIITKQRDGTAIHDVWDGSDEYQFIATKSGITEVQAQEALLSGAIPLNVTQEIRYHVVGAAKVSLVWGIDGWQTLPEADRPAGTVIKEKLMSTPMTHKGDAFVTTVQVPTGSKLEYGFSITQEPNDTAGKAIWDGSDDYQLIATKSGSTEVQAKVALSPDGTVIKIVDAPMVNQKIRYHLDGAGEVFLVWGIDGWQALPEAQRPAGTVITKKLMSTPMSLEDDVFLATVQVPKGSTLDYGFTITKKRNGSAIDAIWDGSDKYRLIAKEPAAGDIYSTIILPVTWLDMLVQWGWIVLLCAVVISLLFLLRHKLKNPYLDF
jgi:hypothetical protein